MHTRRVGTRERHGWDVCVCMAGCTLRWTAALLWLCSVWPMSPESGSVLRAALANEFTRCCTIEYSAICWQCWRDAGMWSGCTQLPAFWSPAGREH
jgi:hypothetical protein